MTDPMRRRLGVFLSVLLLGGFVAAEAPPAAAQGGGLGWLGGIFGGGTPQRSPSPSYPGYGSPFGGGYGQGSDSGYYSAPRRRAQRKKRPAEQTQDAAAKPKVPGKTATLFVDVYGDSMGQLLAGGLDEALADRAEVGIVHKAKGSTGLVTTNFYDWPKTIREQLNGKDKDVKKDKDAKKDEAKKDETKKDASGKEAARSDPKSDAKGDAKSDAKDDKAAAEKVDVAVMMIGINDRQTIVEDGKKYEPGTDEWTAIYKKRVLAIAEAFAKKKIPLIWVGIPITKDDNFADDMAALNDLYREAAAKTGATYVDTWEAFSDENGNFAANGPDINGQTTRLRAGDGIHFTKAGARKLAHFVETHVRRDLDGKAPAPQLPTAEAPADGKVSGDGKTPAGEKKGDKPAVAVVKPEAGPIKNLAEAPTAKDGRLTDVPKDTNLANFSAKGQVATPPVPAGRADDFRWPQAGAPPAQ